MRLTSFCRLVCAMAACALCVACTKLSPGGLWALRDFDFEHFDPALLRVALYLPSHIGIGPDALRIDTKVRTRPDATPQVEHFVMRASGEAVDAAALPGAAAGRWVVLRLDAPEVERVRALRQRVLAQKAQASGHGSLTLGLAPNLCHTGATPEGDARISAALYWTPDKGYVTLLRDADFESLRSMLSELPDMTRC